jgi:ribonuclease E
MLLSSTQPDKLRVAVVADRIEVDIVLDVPAEGQSKSNIYNGVIVRVEPSQQCCFVDYGADREGRLPFSAVAPGRLRAGAKRSLFATKLEGPQAGQEIMVQVVEEDGGDGALLTSHISLAGHYLNLFADAAAGEASRQGGDEFGQALSDTIAGLKAPQGMALAPRPGAIGRSVAELKWDLRYLTKLWSAINNARKHTYGGFWIYQPETPVVNALLGYFNPTIDEILVDSDEFHEQAYQFMQNVFPDMANRVKHYQEPEPLFSLFAPTGAPRSSEAERNTGLRIPDLDTGSTSPPGPEAQGWLRQLVGKFLGA